MSLLKYSNGLSNFYKSYILGAPKGKRIIIFVDDLNMPKHDTYGSQPPIELLRQYQDFGGLYDREKMYWKVGTMYYKA